MANAMFLEMQGCVGSDGASPAGHEVEGDFRCAGLAHVFLGLCFTSFHSLEKKSSLASVTHTSRHRRFEPEEQLDLSSEALFKNIRKARRGAAGGPSGMTVEHLRPLLSVTGP